MAMGHGQMSARDWNVTEVGPAIVGERRLHAILNRLADQNERLRGARGEMEERLNELLGHSPEPDPSATATRPPNGVLDVIDEELESLGRIVGALAEQVERLKKL